MDHSWKPEEIHIDPSRPIYEQLVEQIRAEIAREKIAPGARLPSVRELAATLRVNPTTVMRTYQELERERLIVTYRGQGTFVTKDLTAIATSKRTIAIEAVNKLKQTAEMLGLTLEEMLIWAEQEKE